MSRMCKTKGTDYEATVKAVITTYLCVDMGNKTS